jgi:hypothetical protein
VPTKAARHAENGRSWRIDCTGSSKGKASGSKHDKLVLEFSSDKDCHEFQAALSVCKIGPQKVIDDRNAASARAAARKAEDDRKAAADAAAMSEMLRLKKIADEEIAAAAAAAKIEAERVRKIIEQLQAAGSALAIVTNPLRNQIKRFSVLPPLFPYLSLSPLNLSYKADQAASVAATDLMSSSDTAPMRVVLLFN